MINLWLKTRFIDIRNKRQLLNEPWPVASWVRGRWSCAPLDFENVIFRYFHSKLSILYIYKTIE